MSKRIKPILILLDINLPLTTLLVSIFNLVADIFSTDYYQPSFLLTEMYVLSEYLINLNQPNLNLDERKTSENVIVVC